jgi:flavin-dependent dehydrogenase
MKVHVVGAGPAGSIAAISALRNGHDVIVSEDHPISGNPENCSGLFSKTGLESFGGFVKYKKFVINPIYGADIHFVSTTLRVRRDVPVGFACNRSALDQALVAKAEEEGAQINYNERITDKFHTNNIIGADGPFSNVAKHFSMGSVSRYASTLKALVDYKAKDPHAVEVFLSNSNFPGFFGWIIPHNEEKAEFGVGVMLPNSARDAWERLLRIKKVSAPKPHGWTIPIDVRTVTGKKTGKYKVLVAGDAAGQVKSTTGGGVIFGGNCAAIAGKFADDPLRYEVEWRLKFGPDLAVHKFIHNYLAEQSDEGIIALGRRLKKMNCDEYLSNHGHMDRPTKMIHPQIITHLLKNITGV